MCCESLRPWFTICIIYLISVVQASVFLAIERPLLFNEQEDWDETQTQKMEAARKAYEAAVAAAKERQDEESIAAAASARLHLQSFVLKT